MQVLSSALWRDCLFTRLHRSRHIWFKIGAGVLLSIWEQNLSCSICLDYPIYYLVLHNEDKYKKGKNHTYIGGCVSIKNCAMDRAPSWSTLSPALTVPHHDLTLGKKKRWVAFPGAHSPRMPQERNQTTERKTRQSKVWG